MALPEHTARPLDPTDDNVWLRLICAVQPKGTDGTTLTWAGVTVHAESVEPDGHSYRINWDNGRCTYRLARCMTPGLLAMVR